MNEYPETRATGRHNGDRSPDEIVADLDHTRARMDADLAALQDRLSPGYLMDEVLRFVRQGSAAEYFRNLGETAKRNPMPLALVSTGLAWLAFSSGRGQTDYTRPQSVRGEPESEHSDYPGAYSPSAADLYTGDPDVDLLIASEYEESAEPTSETGERSFKEKARSTTEGMKQSAQGAKARAGAAVESAKDKAHDVAERARHGLDAAKSRMHGVSESTRHGMDSAREQARIRARQAREQARRAREGTSRFIHEQPLAAAGIGVAIGALLGGLLPKSRREDQLMGRSSDRLKQAAGEQASTLAEKGREAAQSATETAHRAVGGGRSGAGRPQGESAASAGPRSVTGNESLQEGEERAGRMSGDAAVGVTEVEVVTGAQGTDVKPGTDSGRTRR